MIELEEVKAKRRLADHYYDNYRRLYLQGEYSKASEYIWGAVNALAYALGLFEGMKLSDHGKVVKFLKLLANQHKEVAEGVLPIQRLHANFFHDFMDEEMFKEDAAKAERLMGKLAELVDHKVKSVFPQLPSSQA
jgi:Arc/MetJ-type ribon-helix-helix transcriptional regulator